MRHLYASVVCALHLEQTNVDGMAQEDWIPYGDIRDAIRCRLDLNFIRPGKDALPVIEAGRAPDRVGVLFCDTNTGLRAGDRIVATSGPVTGTFEVRAVPDVAQGFSAGHHIEVQIFESNQDLSGKISS